MFRNMSPASRGVVLKFLNLVWQMGEMPLLGGIAVVVPTLKPNKMKSD